MMDSQWREKQIPATPFIVSKSLPDYPSAWFRLRSADSVSPRRIICSAATFGQLPDMPFERSRRAADASRGIIWQGNCDAQLTIPVQVTLA